MTKLLAIREHPDQARASLSITLNAASLQPTAASDFRDFVGLNDKVVPPRRCWIGSQR